MKERLKIQKGSLRKWNIEVYGKIDLEIEDIVEAINVDNKFIEWCDYQLEEVVKGEVMKHLVFERILESKRTYFF